MRRPLLAAATVALSLLGSEAGGAVGRLGVAVRPLSQAVDLALDPRREDYRGTTRIELEVSRESASIRLHAREVEIERCELVGDGGELRRLHATAGPEAVVDLADGRSIAPGHYRLTIRFSQQYNRNAVALYKTEFRGEPYLYTQFEASDARGAFPVFDEPGFKIPFELALTIPAGFEALANTGIERETPEADGGRTLRFRRSPPLPAYLVALAVGPFDFVEIRGLSIPGRVVTPRGMGRLAGAAVEATPPLLAALERWFGSPYPYDKLDLVAVPEYWFGAMENPGAITYHAEILLPGEAPSASARLNLVRIHAHELAHMWFGDYVTLAWWDDFWLNESFADWMGDKIASRVYPELGLVAAELGAIDRQMTADARPSALPIRLADATPETAMQNVGAAYYKGKAVLAMVEGWIGEERFRAGVLDYLARHAWGNATSGDLWDALGRASELPVSSALRSFVEQPGLPLVEVESLDGARARLTQRRYATAGVALSPQRWQVPVRLRAGEGARAVEARVLLGADPVEVAFDGLARLDWVLPNAGPSGYYRWRLPSAELDRLAAAAPSALAPLERQHLLGNAAALLASGGLGADAYLALLARLATDADAGVVDGVLQALETIRQPLALDGRAPGWSGYVRAVLAPALARIGRLPRPDESPQVAALRPRLLERIGRDGADAEALAWARDETAGILAGTPGLDDALAGVALRLAALDSDRALYERYLERALRPEADPTERARFLRALTSFRSHDLAAATLALFPAGRVRGDELDFVFALAEVDETMPDRLLDWTMEQYPRIERALPPEFRAFLVALGGGCEPARHERSAAFFGAPERRAPGVEQRIARTGDQVRACVELRAREGAAAGRYLAAFAAE